MLIVADGYRFAGKDYDRAPVIAEILAELPTVRHVFWFPYLFAGRAPAIASARPWSDLASAPAVARETFVYERVGFDHPLWVLFSSGTTGLPKAIVHGHAGTLVEHLKSTGHRRRRRALEARVFLLDDRLDDVERAPLRAVARRLGRALRRPSRLSRTVAVMEARGGRPSHDVRREPDVRLDDAEGGRRAARAVRSHRTRRRAADGVARLARVDGVVLRGGEGGSLRYDAVGRNGDLLGLGRRVRAAARLRGARYNHGCSAWTCMRGTRPGSRCATRSASSS